MPEATEPLTEADLISKVDGLLANRIAILFSTDHERSLMDLLSRLRSEVTRLCGEIADYEQTDLVPRSRYDAVNADWLEARAQVQTLADKAKVEIERLESENAALREQLAEAHASIESLTQTIFRSKQAVWMRSQCVEKVKEILRPYELEFRRKTNSATNIVDYAALVLESLTLEKQK